MRINPAFQFNSPLDNADLAVLQLSEPEDMGSVITLVNLTTASVLEETGTPVELAGWGDTGVDISPDL